MESNQALLKHVPQLPSCNQVRPPNTDLYSDTTHIREVAESLIQSGRKVVAIAHSYGGQVCSNALHGLGVEARLCKNLDGGVSALIYMCSWALPEGSTALDKTEEFGNMDLIPLVFDVADDMTAVVRDPRIAFVDPGVSESDAEVYLDTLVRWNFICVKQRIEHAAWREIPVKYIFTTADMMVPLHYQQSVVEGIEKAGVKVDTFELNIGHCPWLSDSKAVVDIVDRVVSA